MQTCAGRLRNRLADHLSATFVCTLTGDLGCRNSVVTPFAVAKPPNVRQHMESEPEAEPRYPDTTRGTSMLFSCTIIGSPTLTVLKYHSASSVLSPTQPWLTFS